MSFSISSLGFSFVVFATPYNRVILFGKKVILKPFHKSMSEVIFNIKLAT